MNPRKLSSEDENLWILPNVTEHCRNYLEEMYSYNVDSPERRWNPVDEKSLKLMKHCGFSIEEIEPVGYSFEELFPCECSPVEIDPCACGYSLEEMKPCECFLEEMKSSNCSLRKRKPCECSLEEMKPCDCSLRKRKPWGFSLGKNSLLMANSRRNFSHLHESSLPPSPHSWIEICRVARKGESYVQAQSKKSHPFTTIAFLWVIVHVEALRQIPYVRKQTCF